MVKTDALQGSLDVLVLKLLSRRLSFTAAPSLASIASASGEALRVEERSLYPEWIGEDTGRRTRVYELTSSGKKQRGAEESRWYAITLAINRVLREA